MNSSRKKGRGVKQQQQQLDTGRAFPPPVTEHDPQRRKSWFAENMNDTEGDMSDAISSDYEKIHGNKNSPAAEKEAGGLKLITSKELKEKV